jgi:hypothetical protein
VSRRNSSCGARTHACRVRTHANAKRRVSTRPRVIFDCGNDASPDGVPLNVSSNPIPLVTASDPMIVGLPLPKLFASPIEKPVRVASSRSLERFQEPSRRTQRQQQHVYMIRHDDERSKLVMAEFSAAEQRIEDQLRDSVLPQERRATSRGIEVAIYPSKGFARRSFRGRRESSNRQTTVQRPRDEQPTALGIAVWQASSGVHAFGSVFSSPNFSRSHECERGTQECVRHIAI